MMRYFLYHFDTFMDETVDKCVKYITRHNYDIYQLLISF